MQPILKSITLIACQIFVLVATVFSQEDSLGSINKQYYLGEHYRIQEQVLANDTAVRHGKFETFYRGDRIIVGRYVEGKRFGKWTHYYRTGKPFIEAAFVNDLKHGKWVYYYPSGKIMCEAYYKLGNRTSTWKSYSGQEKLMTEITYEDNAEFGTQKTYHENGALKEEALQLPDSLGRKIIQITAYYDDGARRKRLQLVNDTLHGPLELFFPNRLPWMKLEYDMGRLIHIHEMRDIKGTPKNKGSFESGTGEAKFWDADGKLYAIENYRDGLRYGKAEYYLDGNLWGKGHYKNNQMIGTWTYFSSTGEIRLEQNHYDATGEYYVTYFHGSGQERTEGLMQNKMRTGTWKTYNFHNEIITEENYLFGLQHGAYVAYQNTRPTITGGYFFGEKVGEWQYFNPKGKITHKELFIKEITVDTNAIKVVDEFQIVSMKNSFEPQIIEWPLNFTHYKISDLNWIKESMKLPNQAPNQQARGYISVQYKVDEFGLVKDVNLARGIGYGFDDAVLNITSQMPPYHPKFIDGIPVVSTVSKVIFLE